jgi:tetratricopeptide (TPR) repeat protein
MLQRFNYYRQLKRCNFMRPFQFSKIAGRIFLFLLFSFSLFSCSEKKSEQQEAKKEVDSFAKLNNDIKENPGRADLYFERAKVFAGRNVLQQAFEDAQKAISLDSTKAEYYFLLADISFKGLQITKAVGAFEKVIALEPRNTDAMLKLSELYLYIKLYPKSIFYANEALRVDKNISKAYFLKGFSYKEAGDTGRSVSSFQTAVDLQPDNYDAYIQLGNIYAAKKNPVALQYYENALRIRPSSTEALYNRGLFFQNSGNTEKAVEDYNTIIKLDPTYGDAYYNLGYINVTVNKDYKEAVKNFTDAIRVTESYAEAFYNRGVAFEMLGDKASAEKDYRKALEIVPTFKLAKRKLEKN